MAAFTERTKYASDSTLDFMNQVTISEMRESFGSKDNITDNSSEHSGTKFQPGAQVQLEPGQQLPVIPSQISHVPSYAQLEPKAFATTSVICIVCNQLKNEKFFWQTTECDHSYTICLNCIKIHIRKCIQTGEKEINCLYPECTKAISKDHVMSVVQQEPDRLLLIEKLNSQKQQIESPPIRPSESASPARSSLEDEAALQQKKQSNIDEQHVGCQCIIN